MFVAHRAPRHPGLAPLGSPPMRASFGTVSTASVFTIVLFSTVTSVVVAILFVPFFVSVLVVTAAVSGLGALLASPLGILFALAAHRLLARYDSLLVHALGSFVAGAATGAIVAIIASPLLAPIGHTLAHPALALMIAGIFALLGGASAAAGWRIAFAISR